MALHELSCSGSHSPLKKAFQNKTCDLYRMKMTFDDYEYCRDGNLFDCFSLMKVFWRAYSPCSLHQFLCQDHLQTAQSLSMRYGHKERQTGHLGLLSEILGTEDSTPGSLPRLRQGSVRV